MILPARPLLERAAPTTYRRSPYLGPTSLASLALASCVLVACSKSTDTPANAPSTTTNSPTAANSPVKASPPSPANPSTNSSSPSSSPTAKSSGTTTNITKSKTPDENPRAKTPPPSDSETPDLANATQKNRNPADPNRAKQGRAATQSPRKLGDLLPQDVAAKQNQTRDSSRPHIDDEKAKSVGLRKLAGAQLTLYTDLPDLPEIAELPRVFELAVPQLCNYFSIPVEEGRKWKATCYLMRDSEPFRKAGAIPDELPEFENGITLGDEFWVQEQETAYFRRHLVLHEAVHSFMFHFLNGAGPTWYMEGTAELLATHQWRDDKLALRHSPRDRDELPGWGRVRILQDDFTAARGMNLEQILALAPNSTQQVRAYGWSWAAAAFFDQHPLSAKKFREMATSANEQGPEFNRRLASALGEHWSELREDWQVFAFNIDYGYDFARAAAQRKPGQPLPADGASITVQTDRGWQSTGMRLEAGRKYEITAQGRYQIVGGDKPWLCEPNGVTLRYERGRPLGQLIASLRPDSQPDAATLGATEEPAVTPLVRYEAVGLKRQLSPETTGTLYLRVNESAAGLADNQGEISVSIKLAD